MFTALCFFYYENIRINTKNKIVENEIKTQKRYNKKNVKNKVLILDAFAQLNVG